jgi:hypothetical protein
MSIMQRQEAYKIKRLTQRKATRLATLLLFSFYIFAMPALFLNSRILPRISKKAEAHACSCPMCRAVTPGHHCNCCDHGETCTCQVSSNDQEDPEFPPARPALLKIRVSATESLEYTLLSLSTYPSIPEPSLAVPKPPPKRDFS